MKNHSNISFIQPKFYLKKNKKYNTYYVVISIYNPQTKKNVISYKSLYTTLKPEALKNFNQFVSSYLNPQPQLNRNITLLDFYSEIRNQLKSNLRNTTLKIYDYSIKKFVEICSNKMLRLYEIKDVELFKSERIKQDVTKFEVNKEYATIKAVFNLALKMNYLNKNVCTYVKKYSTAETKIKIFTDLQVEMLLNNIENPVLLNIVRFAMLTGLRLNEILNLKESNINYAEGIIEVFQSKTQKNKIVILTSKLQELLKEIIPAKHSPASANITELNTIDKYLFTLQNRNTAISKNYISHLFKSELRKLNIPEDLHFHSLRHTYITNLIRKGIPLNFVQQIIGHLNINTTMQYIHISKDELTKYANMI